MSIERKRFQDKIPESEYRFHSLKVRLNSEELEILDVIKGQHSRSVAVRFLIMSNMPPTVSQINKDMWISLSKSAANINQISRHLNSGGSINFEEIRRELESFRAKLLGA